MDDQTQVAPAQPFWQSHVFISSVAGGVSAGLVLLNVHVDPGLLSSTAEGILSTIAALAPLWSAWKRWRSRVQPLTLTQPKADAKNIAAGIPPTK